MTNEIKAAIEEAAGRISERSGSVAGIFTERHYTANKNLAMWAMEEVINNPERYGLTTVETPQTKRICKECGYPMFYFRPQKNWHCHGCHIIEQS